MAVIGSLLIELFANVARLQQDMNRATRLVEGFANSAQRALGTLGIAVPLSGFALFVKGAIDAQDEIVKLSQKVGVSVESLSALKFAGQLADVSLESLGTGLRILSRNMSDTQANTGEARQAFAALGIQVTNSSGQLRSGEQVLLDVADKFAGMEDGAAKTAIAMRLFGRSGADLIPLLNQGRAGLADATEEARRLGVVFGEDAAKKAEMLNDNLTRLKTIVDGLAISLASVVVGPLNSWIEANLEAIRIAGSLTEALRLFVFNLDAMTGEKPAEQIRRLTKELKEFQEAGPLGKFIQSPTGFLFGGREEDLRKQIEFLEFLKSREESAPPAPKDSEAAARAAAAAEAAALARQQQMEAAAKAAAEAAKKRQKLMEDTAKAIADAEEIAAQVSTEAWQAFDRDRLAAAEFTAKAIADAEAITAEETREAWFFAYEVINDRQKQLAAEQEESARRMLDVGRELGFTFSSAFENAIVGGKKFSEVLRGIEQDIARIIIRKSVTEPAADAIGTFIKGIDFGGFFKAPDASVFRADGGPVLAGSPYIVGERGPELFVPRQSGTVLPNGALAGAGDMNLNLTFNIQAWDSRDAAAAIYAQRNTIVGVVQRWFNANGRTGPAGR